MKRSLQGWVMGLSGLLLSALLMAQTPAPPPAAPKERTPIVLEHAKTLSVVEEAGVRKQELHGDVRITKDSLTVTCQDAVYYPDSGILIFQNNVVFEDPNRILMADEVRYNEFTEEVNAAYRVRVYQHDTLSVTSQTARYFERLQQGYLYNTVQMRYESRRLLLTGDQGFADHSREYGRVTGKPLLTERDSSQQIVTKVRGDTIEYFGQEKRARVTGHVKVDRDSLEATGDLLDYFTEARMAVLVGSPEAYRGPDHVVGDTMKLYFEGEDLSRVEVIGNTLVTSPVDSGFPEPRHRMQGKQLTMWIDSGAVREVLIEGTATADYYVREKEEKRGLNQTSGDRLRVFFEDGKMTRIRVEGGTEGDFIPQRLVKEMPADSAGKRQ